MEKNKTGMDEKEEEVEDGVNILIGLTVIIFD